jgi:hypothetical protein
VQRAEEPEEFVANVMNKFDPNVIQAIVGGYTIEQIVRGVAQVEPKAAGSTPAGRTFIREAFTQLRRALLG